MADRVSVREVQGVRYDVVGEGPSTLLLVHGGSGRRQWFDGLTAQLAPHVRQVRVDLPGHGESRWTTGRYRLEDSAEALSLVADHAGIESCWVVGHSHGAHVGVVLAAERPDLVATLVVGDAPLDPARMAAHHHATAATNRAWRRLTGPDVPEDDRLAGFLATPVGDGATIGDLFEPGHPYVREMVTSLRHHDGDFLDAVLKRFDETYARLGGEVLASLQCRVMLLQGDPAAGGLLTDDDVTWIRSHVATAETGRLVGVGHGLQLQDPGQVAEALRRWLPGSD